VTENYDVNVPVPVEALKLVFHPLILLFIRRHIRIKRTGTRVFRYRVTGAQLMCMASGPGSGGTPYLTFRQN